MCEGLTFNFVREDIIKKCEEFELLTEQIKYLECVLKEYKTSPPELDENYGIVPTLEDWIESHLRWRKFLLDEPKSNAAGLAKIKGRNIDVDIARVFDAMIESDMIWSGTEVKQIVRIFFSERIDIENNVASYNARTNEIEKGRKSNSKTLMKFIKILIEKSYKGKDNAIFELQEFLEKL